MNFYLSSYAVVALLLANIAPANALTAEEACRQRNAASCEISGLKFFITEEECPRGAKVLRPRGKERCDNLAEKPAIARPHSAVSQAAPVPTSAPLALQEEAEDNFLKIPFLIVAVIGVIQGLVSRAGWGQFIVVGIVMPVLVTWGTVSGVAVQASGMQYLGYLGLEFLPIFLFALAGWGIGLALHRTLLKLLPGK